MSMVSSLQAPRTGAAAQLTSALRGKTSLVASHGQQALWFMQQQAPESSAYHVAACLELQGQVEAPRMAKAIEHLVARHGSLRTRFVMREGKLIQQVGREAVFDWSAQDTQAISEERFTAALEEAYHRPFDLAAGPVCRARLYRRAPDRWVLLLVIHHIAVDGWSLWQLLEELQVTYAQGVHPRGGEAAADTDYFQFVVKQRALLRSAEGKRQLDYWREALAGELPVLQLPGDQPRPAQQTFSGASLTHEFGESFSVRCRAFCREHQVTPFVFGLTVYFALLHRLCEQDDILVAAPFAGRGDPDADGVVGYFVNPVPVRAQLGEAITFDRLLAQVKGRVFAAQANQDVPFPVLCEELQVRRDPSYPVLCQAMFVYQQVFSGPNTIGFDDRFYPWGEWQARHYPLGQQAGQVDLALELLEGEERLTAHWKFNPDVVSSATVASAASAYEALALAAMDDPSCALTALRLVSAAQADALMAPPAKAFAVTTYLQDRFAQSAQQHHDRIAVTCGSAACTYAQLDARANGIAQGLLDAGVRPGDPVGIALPRSIDLVAAIVAVLKAGACYVPMDPNYPADRVRYMAQDSGARWVLADTATAAGVPDGARALLIEDCPARGDAPEVPAHTRSPQDALAYILYTSGSTGRPKGVCVSHANVQRLFAATQALYAFDEQDVWTLFHSYAFDFSVWELWGALLHGGRLVVVPYEVSRSPREFHGLLAREQVTVLNATPSAFQQLSRVDTSASDALCALRWVVFGGEALDLPSLRPWFAKHGDAQPTLVNMYGITETTVHVTHRVLRAADVEAAQSLIGQPLDDLHLCILDPHGQPVPVGFPGEIHVGGAGVTQGYWQRPDLTAERFVSNPTVPGSARYRTGDLGRWVSARDIAYLGRLDDQVQLRGFRIELGEIEAQLTAAPDVNAATVILDRAADGDARLVAYYVSASGAPLPWTDLRAHLATRLADYMVPSIGVQLEALALTANGKVDRQALPAPQVAPNGQSTRPRDALEQQLAGLWAELLGLDEVGVTDNFFELGGHSLLAARLSEQVEATLERPCPVATVLRAPTVEALARELRSANVPWSPTVPLNTRGAGAPLFCVPGGSGNALYYQPLAQALGQGRPVYGLQARGLDGEAPAGSVEAMAKDNVEALLRSQPYGPYLLLGHCFGAVIAYEMALQLQSRGREVERLIVLDAPAPVPAHRAVLRDCTASEWLGTFMHVLEASTGVPFEPPGQDFADRPLDEQLELSVQYMVHAGLVPSDATVRQGEGMLNVFRNNSQLSYQPKEFARFPVTLLRASEFSAQFDYSAADDAEDLATSSLGWRRLADDSLEIRCVPGDHISMLKAPHVGELATVIQRTLSAAPAPVAVASSPCGS